jgi:N-acetylglucosaminyldiphosphoundecaprenol N-acetyl-beta-D-mannosaminyltransferase
MKESAEVRRGRDAKADATAFTSAVPRRLSSQRATIVGIAVDNLSEEETVSRIEELISDGGSHYGAVVNAAKLVAASRDARLQRVLLDATLITADGMSVVWASRLLRPALKQRVTGIDLFQRLVELAAERGLSVYFLGASEQSVKGTAEKLTARHPKLRVAGYRNGYFAASESAAVADAIKESATDLLFVAMGSPAQEFWIASNLERTAVRFALGVGGSFDNVSGFATRAPRWMQRLGLEWFHRLTSEPRRLWKRYLVGNTVFVWLVVKQLLTSRP